MDAKKGPISKFSLHGISMVMWERQKTTTKFCSANGTRKVFFLFLKVVFTSLNFLILFKTILYLSNKIKGHRSGILSTNNENQNKWEQHFFFGKFSCNFFFFSLMQNKKMTIQEKTREKFVFIFQVEKTNNWKN